MGSACETADEAVDYLNGGEKTGAVRERLYRPFPVQALLDAIPPTVKRIAVLDRTKEPGAPGEPLYLDVVRSLAGAGRQIEVYAGRYGLGSKDTRPSHLLSVFRNRDLIVLSILGILPQFLCFAAPTLFSAVAAEDLGASSLQIGMLNLIFFVSTGVFSLFVGGRLYKRIGGIRAMAIAFLTCALSLVPAFYHMNIPVIYVMQAVAGISYGVTNSAAAGMVIRSVPPEQRGAANGIFQSMYGIGILTGPVLAGDITKWVSFDAAYWTLAAIAVASALLCCLWIPKKYAAM
jgi:predicted MFS family arabinose efflux permease